MPKVVVVGSANMDLVVRAPRFATAGETILGSAFYTVAGGKGANQAVAARRMGADVAMVGRVGEDNFGAALQHNLAREGIDIGHLITTQGISTGVALITVEDRGENTIIVVPGANGRVSPEDTEAALPRITEADVLLMQLEIPLPAVERAARAARESGVTVILNAAPAQPLPERVLSLADYLVVNESEARLAAAAGSGATSVEEAARTLRSMGARNVVGTLGPQGSMLAANDGTITLVPAFPVKAVDTTAAGDAFVGAFAVALAEGLPAEEALRRGNAAGALAVTREGAQPSLPSRAEVEQFLRS